MLFLGKDGLFWRFFKKGLYDQDYVEEEAILSWYENVPADDSRALKAKLKVAPLAQWFKEAESEESDEWKSVLGGLTRK